MLGTKRKKVCDMKILRRMPITIAVISAMMTVASWGAPASDLTILEAISHKLVLSLPDSISQASKNFEEAERLAAEHCKKFDKVAGGANVLTQPGPPSIVLTFQCFGQN